MTKTQQAIEKQGQKVRDLRAMWEQEKYRWLNAMYDASKYEVAALRRSMNNLDRRLTNAEARLYELKKAA